MENHLRAFPQGVVTFDGVPFDVRGLVVCGDPSRYYRQFVPGDTRGIQVGQRCRRLHFLHFGIAVPENHGIVGRYRLHFANGATHDLELRGEADLLDWWHNPGDTPEGPSRIVWRGQIPSTERNHRELTISVRTWDNPQPEEEVVSVDVLGAGQADGGIALIALTVE